MVPCLSFIILLSVYTWSNSIWNCSESIVITPLNDVYKPFNTDSRYPDNSTCQFFVIVDDASPNHLVLMDISFHKGLNDSCRIADERGLSTSSITGESLYGGNFSMILKTGPSTNGTLYFEYKTVELSNTNSTMESVNVTVNRFQVISPNQLDLESRRLIWVNSTDPFVIVFQKEHPFTPVSSFTFFYHNDLNGKYLGALYDYRIGMINVTEKPYKALVYSDFRISYESGYSDIDYQLLAVPISVVDRYSSYQYFAWYTLKDEQVPLCIEGNESAPGAVFISDTSAIVPITFSDSSQWLEWRAGPGENLTETMSFKEADNITTIIEPPLGGSTFVAYKGVISLLLSVSPRTKRLRYVDAGMQYIITTPYYGTVSANQSMVWTFKSGSTKKVEPLDIYVTSVDCDQCFYFLIVWQIDNERYTYNVSFI